MNRYHISCSIFNKPFFSLIFKFKYKLKTKLIDNKLNFLMQSKPIISYFLSFLNF